MEVLLSVLKWSLVCGAAAVLASALKGPLDRRFSPRWRYWLWLVLALALLLSPVRWERLLPALPEPAVTVAAPEVRLPVYRPATPVSPVEPDEPVTWDTPVAPVTPSVPQTSSVPEAPAVSRSPAARRDVPLSAVLTAVWLAGAAAFLAWHMAGTALLLRRIRRWSVTPRAEVRETYGVLCRELGVRRAPELTVSRNLGSPMAAGLLRPRLCLPDREFEGRELEFILRHELTHVRRRDLWYKALILAANALHWFDPLIWLLRREAGETVELLCDAEAMGGADGETRRAYCETLLMNIRRERGAALTTHFYGGARSVKNRFKNLLNSKNRRFGWAALAAGLLAVAVASCAVGVRDGRGWTADLTLYDPDALLGEGFTVEATGLSSGSPEISARGGFGFLQEFTVTPEGLSFTVPVFTPREGEGWVGLLWSAVLKHPVNGEDLTETADPLRIYLRIWMDGEEREAELFEIVEDGDGWAYHVRFREPLTEEEAESGTLYIACGTVEWIEGHWQGSEPTRENWSVDLSDDRVYDAVFSGFGADVTWTDGQLSVEHLGDCSAAEYFSLNESCVSFSLYDYAPEEIRGFVLPIREFAVYDYLRDNTEDDRRENTPELRAALEKRFVVTLDSVTIPGELVVTGGNGHIDFAYVFDEPLTEPVDGTVHISVGTEEWIEITDPAAAIGAERLSEMSDRLNSDEWNGFVTHFYRSTAEMELYDILYMGAGIDRDLTEEERERFSYLDDCRAADIEQVTAMLRQRTTAGGDRISDMMNGGWRFSWTETAMIWERMGTNHVEVRVTSGTERDGTERYEICRSDGNYLGTLTLEDGKIASFTNPVYDALRQEQERYLAALTSDGVWRPGLFETDVHGDEEHDVIRVLNAGAGTYAIEWTYMNMLTDSMYMGEYEETGFWPCTVLSVDENGAAYALATLTSAERAMFRDEQEIVDYFLAGAGKELPSKEIVSRVFEGFLTDKASVLRVTRGGATEETSVNALWASNCGYEDMDWREVDYLTADDDPNLTILEISDPAGTVGLRMDSNGNPLVLTLNGESRFFTLGRENFNSLWSFLYSEPGAAATGAELVRTAVERLRAYERAGFTLRVTRGNETWDYPATASRDTMYADSTPAELLSLAWRETDEAPERDPESLTVTLLSADGRCEIGLGGNNGSAAVTCDGETRYYALGADRERLWDILFNMADQEVRSWTLNKPLTAPGDLTSSEAAETMAETVVKRVQSLPDWVEWRPLAFEAEGAEVFDEYLGEPRNFCAALSFRLKLTDEAPDSPARTEWEIGSGLSERDPEGRYGWARECLVMKNEAGDWELADMGTGGYMAELPGYTYSASAADYVGNAPLSELLRLMTLTEGKTLTERLPMYIFNRPYGDLQTLPSLLSAFPVADRAKVRDALTRYASAYGTKRMSELTEEQLAELLDTNIQSE